jgi:hypothetical protein
VGAWPELPRPASVSVHARALVQAEQQWLSFITSSFTACICVCTRACTCPCRAATAALHQSSSRLLTARPCLPLPSPAFLFVPSCREVSYSAPLLAAAQQDPHFIAQLELAFSRFLADGKAQRVGLPPMQEERRALAHSLAEAYGLASSSAGAGAARHVQLFRTQHSCPPARLLSRVAPTVRPEEVAAMLQVGVNRVGCVCLCGCGCGRGRGWRLG